MKQIIRTGLGMLLVLSLLLTAALAEGIVISDREKAIRLADKALEEKYGITQLTQEYFGRTATDEGNGTFVIEYKGQFDWAYVLGTYKVTVVNGAVTETIWTHDGEDTSGGLSATAWGNEQILEMLKLNQEYGDMDIIERKVQPINEKVGFTPTNDYTGDWDYVAVDDKENAKIPEQNGHTLQEYLDTAKEGIRIMYELSDEQAAKLRLAVVDAESDAYDYVYFHGVSCIRVAYILEGSEEPELLPSGVAYNDKEGNYWVYINVVTGAVEEIIYSAAIGGNG